MKRKFGASILAGVLAFLSVVGFGNAYAMFAEPGYGAPVLGILALLYGIAAFASAVGLWRMRKWAYRAFLSWVAVVLLMSVVMQLSYIHLPWLQWLGFWAVAGTGLWLLARYVRKVSAFAL